MNRNTPTGFDYITLGVAVLGVVLGGLSLLWQIIQFKLTGSHVRVATTRALAIESRASIKVVGIRASNQGRTPVAVTGIGFLPQGSDQKLALLWNRIYGGPQLPHTLEPGQEANWAVTEDEIKRTLAENYWGPEIKAYVELGTGKRRIATKGEKLQ